MGLINKNKTNTNNTENNDFTTNIDAVDNRVGGDASIFGGNVTAQNIGSVTATDYGAIEAGTGIARNALEFSSNNLANAFQFGDEITKNSTLFGKNALDATIESNKLVSGIAGTALNKLTENNDSVLNFARSVNKDSLGGIGDAIDKVASTVKASNTSDSVQTIKYIGLAVAAIAGIFFIAPIFKTGK